MAYTQNVKHFNGFTDIVIIKVIFRSTCIKREDISMALHKDDPQIREVSLSFKRNICRLLVQQNSSRFKRQRKRKKSAKIYYSQVVLFLYLYIKLLKKNK